MLKLVASAVSITCTMTVHKQSLPQVTVNTMNLQVSSSAMLWGAGTALGEVPPYAFSYHAAKAGKQNEELEKMFGMQIQWHRLLPAICCILTD